LARLAANCLTTGQTKSIKASLNSKSATLVDARQAGDEAEASYSST
jgi:hypothetical protein